MKEGETAIHVSVKEGVPLNGAEETEKEDCRTRWTTQYNLMEGQGAISGNKLPMQTGRRIRLGVDYPLNSALCSLLVPGIEFWVMPL